MRLGQPKAPILPVQATFRGEAPQLRLTLGLFGLLVLIVLLTWQFNQAEAPLRSRSKLDLPIHAAAFSSRLDIRSEPSGAFVYVDERYVGRTPARSIPLYLEGEGMIDLQLRHPGYRPVERRIKINRTVKHGAIHLEFTQPTQNQKQEN